MKKKTDKTGKTDKNSGGMGLFVLGASLAGLAAAYFFLSPKSKKQIEDTKAWAIKMKGDVVERLEQAGEMGEDVYNEIVDSIATKYEKNFKSNPEEVRALAQDLKKHWPALCLSIKDKKINSLKEKPRPAKKSKIVKKA